MKLTKILAEIEFETNNADKDQSIDKGIDQVMAKFMSALKADAGEIQKTANDPDAIDDIADDYPELEKLTKEGKINEEIGTLLVLSILAAMPKILKHLSTAIKWASKLSTGGAGVPWIDKFANKIANVGEAWHHGYIDMVAKLLKLIVPGYKEAPHDVQEKIAETVWMAIVAGLLITSGAGALKAAQSGQAGLAGLETALAAVKRGELAGWLESQLAMALADNV